MKLPSKKREAAFIAYASKNPVSELKHWIITDSKEQVRFIPGVPHQCFQNALEATWEDHSLTYVQGICLYEGDIPLEHGWAIATDGSIVECTLEPSYVAAVVTDYVGFLMASEIVDERIKVRRWSDILTVEETERCKDWYASGKWRADAQNEKSTR